MCVANVVGLVVLYGYFYWLVMWFTDWQTALGLSAASAITFVALWYVGTSKDKAARNPLQGVIAEMTNESLPPSKRMPL
jgi:hypothetical protein